MVEHFRMGGWAMWFILIFGVLAISGAARFAWRGDRALAAFGRWGCLTTIASSVSGFLMGMIKASRYVVFQATPDERWVILVEGASEALNCLTFGGLMTTLTCLLLAIGYRRFTHVETRATA